MWTGVSKLAVGTTILGALAAVLLYLGQSQAVPQASPLVSTFLSAPLLRLVVALALFLALALVILRQHAVERRLPRYEALTDLQEARLRARDEEIARLQERLAEKEEERKRAAAMLLAFLKSADEAPKDER
jgi:phosphate/sulfate permease